MKDGQRWLSSFVCCSATRHWETGQASGAVLVLVVNKNREVHWAVLVLVVNQYSEVHWAIPVSVVNQ
jgi:hypothetical protein